MQFYGNTRKSGIGRFPHHSMFSITRSRKRTLLVVRGKLGDTLTAWPSIRAYADRHPEEEVWFAVRRNYAVLFAGEPGIRLLPFASSAQLYGAVLRLRLSGGIGRLAVLWGFGKAVSRLARLSGAPWRAYLDGRFGKAFSHVAEAEPNATIADAAWRVARLLDPALPRPDKLEIASLGAMRTAAHPQAVALTPVADETRRVLDREALQTLAAVAKERFPGAPLWLLGNPDDKALQPLLDAGLPDGVVLKPFPRLEDLIEALAHTRHLLTTDTGVYHLAAAMGVPATVFFGPTQPAKVVLPGQPGVDCRRPSPLGNRHCEVKDCSQPACLFQAVAAWADLPPPPATELPAGCLLTETQGDRPCAS
jgi:ADP-heptose:LPS heptosyltransferase